MTGQPVLTADHTAPTITLLILTTAIVILNLLYRIILHDKKARLSLIPSFQQQEQFLALAVRSHDVHLFHASQLPAYQRNIRHGRKFQKKQRAGFQKIRKKVQDIGLTVLQPKDLPTISGPSCRVQVNDIRPEISQYLPDRNTSVGFQERPVLRRT